MSVQVESAKNVDRSKLIKWIIALAIPLGVSLIPCNGLFTQDIKMFLVVTALGLSLVALEVANLMAVSVLFPICYVVVGLVPLDVAMSAWTQTMPLVVIGGYMMANVLERVGLLKRIAYFCILKVGGTYYGLLFGIMIAGMILNTATGGNAWVIMAAFTFGLCKTFNLGKSIDSAIIMLVGAFSATSSMVFIYTPYYMSMMLNGAHSVDPSITLSWTQFFFHMCPYLLFTVGFIFILPKLFKPTQKLPGKEYFQEEYQKLGKMSSDEKKALFATVALIVFMMTGSVHGIALDWGFIIIPWLFFFPGMNIGTEEDVKKIDFSMVFFCVSCLCIGTVSSHLGIGTVVSQALLPILEPLSSTVIVGAVYVVAVVLNFLLTPMAVLAGFSEPIAQIAGSLGMNPLGPLYAMFLGMDQVLLPYEYLNYLIFYAFGLIKMKDFMKIMGVKMILGAIFLVAVFIPFWKMIGIF